MDKVMMPRLINIIVFSKDRALQLELFLRSFTMFVKFAGQYDISILYTYSNNNFKLGYGNLINRSLESIHFYKEQSFKEDLISLINVNNEYTVFFVDDIVFKKPLDFYDKQMEVFNQDRSIFCRSLRLHPRLTFCYAKQKPMSPPVFKENNIFAWRRAQGDYGYPMSLDGNIFRTQEILPYITTLEYSNPNTLEGGMAIRPPAKMPFMICYDKSVIVNNPVNIVQTNNANVHGNISASFLNDKFLKGYVISLSPFVGLENISCHQEVVINLIKE